MNCLVCFIACMGAAFDNAQRANGAVPQAIYTADFSWVWWLSALGFAIVGFTALFEGIE